VGLVALSFCSLTIKSRFLPKFLGVLLILSDIAYVVSCVIAIVFPGSLETFNRFAFPFYLSEFTVILWLAFIGAKPRAVE
jgi:hypothetical protein